MAKRGQEVQALANGIIDIPTQRAIRALERSIEDKTNALQGGINTVTTTIVKVAGTSGVTSVSAGSASLTIAPTTGAVVADVTDNGISNAKLRDSAALSVIGRSSNASGDPADIVAASDGDVLRRSGTALGFGAIPESSVTSLVSDLAARPTGSGTAGRSVRWATATSLANGALTDDGTNVTLAGTATLSTMTAGSVLFAGTGGLVSQDNARLFWDNTNKSLTVTSNSASPAVVAVNADAAAGSMKIQNTNASGPVDFFAVDSAGVAQMSWGYGNASYSDTARVGRGYVWRNTGKNFVIARTNTVDIFIDSSGRVGVGTATALTGQLEVNGATPDIYVNGSTSGLVRFGTNGIAAPTFTTRSAGTKIVLYPDLSGSSSDYAIGVESGNVWFSVSGAIPTQGFKWYKGTTSVANLTSDGDLTLTRNLTVNGGATLGDSSSADTHTINGATTVNFAGTGSSSAILAIASPTASTATNVTAVRGNNSGTYNTTAGALTAIAVCGVSSSTRSTGANSLTNIAGYFSASGAQVNTALQTDDGDVVLNSSSGTTTIKGPTTIGDASADAHTLNGTVNANGTAGANTQVLQIISGLPQWSSISTAGGALGAGINQYFAKWTSGTTLSTGSLLETGSGTVLEANYTGGVFVHGLTGNGPLLNVDASLFSASTNTPTAVQGTLGGSFNTTSAGITVTAGYFSSTATRSAGANALTNIALRTSASGAQVNYALYCQQGDVWLLDNGSGALTVGPTSGTLQYHSTVSVKGVSTFAYGATSVNDTSNPTSNKTVVTATTSGATFDTTSGALSAIAYQATATATRGGGTNVLTNYGLKATASGGQTNIAIQTDDGDVILNNTSGTTTIKSTLDMNSHKINNVTDPTSAQDAATKNYVDTLTNRLIGRQILSSSSGTYTPTTGTKRVLVRMIGGGGGGGGAAGGSGARTAGGGGSSGVYWEKWIDPSATVTGGSYACGAAGSAGSSAGGNGGNGGDTTIVVNSTTYTAKGGTGGTGQTADGWTVAKAPQSGSSAADFTAGEPGGHGFSYLGGSIIVAGSGGSSPFGTGGAAPLDGSSAGTGNGSGGSGANHSGTTDRAGGAGTIGLIIVEEYA